MDNGCEEAGFRHLEHTEFRRLSDGNQIAKQCDYLGKSINGIRPAVPVFLES